MQVEGDCGEVFIGPCGSFVGILFFEPQVGKVGNVLSTSADETRYA